MSIHLAFFSKRFKIRSMRQLKTLRGSRPSCCACCSLQVSLLLLFSLFMCWSYRDYNLPKISKIMYIISHGQEFSVVVYDPLPVQYGPDSGF